MLPSGRASRRGKLLGPECMLYSHIKLLARLIDILKHTQGRLKLCVTYKHHVVV